jgi:N-acyl-D-aspartate/D-glutamate deacylase
LADSKNPDIKRKLVEAAREPDHTLVVTDTEARPPECDWVYFLHDMKGPHRSMAQIAAKRGVEPAEAMIDVAVERNLKAFFLQPIANENQDNALEMIKRRRSVVTFSDSGAHVSQVMDASLQTHLLSHWVREKQTLALEEGVCAITFDSASNWGLHGRGLLCEGFAADLAIFDPKTIGPQMPEVVDDLPSSARRPKQKADELLATVVNGQLVLRNQEHTGAYPGGVLRGDGARGRS